MYLCIASVSCLKAVADLIRFKLPLPSASKLYAFRTPYNNQNTSWVCKVGNGCILLTMKRCNNYFSGFLNNCGVRPCYHQNLICVNYQKRMWSQFPKQWWYCCDQVLMVSIQKGVVSLSIFRTCSSSLTFILLPCDFWILVQLFMDLVLFFSSFLLAAWPESRFHGYQWTTGPGQVYTSFLYTLYHFMFSFPCPLVMNDVDAFAWND